MPLFPKTERLHLKRQISDLFEKGEKWSCFPFRVILNFSTTDENASNAQVLVSVSKRNFKNATDRNRLKRQMREAYRLKKDPFLKSISSLSSENQNLLVHIGFIYTSKNKEPWALIERKIEKALVEVINKISN